MPWIWRNSIICTLFALVLYLFIYFSETGLIPDVEVEWKGILLAVILGNGWGIAMYFLKPYFNRLVPWNKNRTSRFAIEVTAGILALIIIGIVFTSGYLKQVQTIEDEHFWITNRDGIIKFGIISISLVYVYSLVNFSIYSYNQYSTGQIESIYTERKQLRLRFEALKSQLSPHFLFNALNTISSLIYKNLDVAENFIRQLAYTYNYILQTDQVRLIQLDKELEMVQAYFFMQQIRFEGCVELNVDVKKNLHNSFIPPLALQMLVENALKHNTISEENPLRIDIFDEGNKSLVVRNNIIPRPELLKIGNNLYDRPPEEDSFNIGLSNIKKRYAVLSKQKIEIKTEKHFEVKLPVIINSDEE